MKKKKVNKHINPSTKDFHHILYQRKHWNKGYAKLLRNHPYMGKMIPLSTLHAEIHSKIHDIPTPNGIDCKRAYLELLERERRHEIDIKHDSLEKRIDFLIEMWEETCPATVAILAWQRQIAAKFYGR